MESGDHCTDGLAPPSPCWRSRLLQTSLGAVVVVGSVVFVAGCGGDDDAGTRAGDEGSVPSSTDRDTGTTRSDDDVIGGDGDRDVSAQEFCDAYFSIDVDPRDVVEFGEAAHDLTAPPEIAEEWEALVEGDPLAAEDVTMWMIANCPQMNG
jgi:hypothetical protein